MEYIEIKEQIKQKLPVARDLGDSENLLELGLSSLTIMRLVNQWRKQGVKVSFGSLMENPTLEGWWALIQRSMKKKAGKKRAQESKITPEKDMKQPFPLTDVQYAYWVGRDEEQALGGIDCHAYLEFDGGNIDPERLEKAWNVLQYHHPMLRACFLDDGTQKILDKPYCEKIKVHDFSRMSSEEAEAMAVSVRERLSHRKLKIEEGEVAGIELTLFPENKARLHVDMALLVADVQSLQILLRDLASAYRGENLPKESKGWNFASYLERQKQEEGEERKNAEKYWKNRLEHLPKGPDLPLAKRPQEVEKTVFNRRIVRIEKEEWDHLQMRAKKYQTTPAMVLLTAYAVVLERWSRNHCFLINIPFFNRKTEQQGLEEVIADFTTLLLLEINCEENPTFAELLDRIQKQLHEDMKYIDYEDNLLENGLDSLLLSQISGRIVSDIQEAQGMRFDEILRASLTMPTIMGIAQYISDCKNPSKNQMHSNAGNQTRNSYTVVYIFGDNENEIRDVLIEKLSASNISCKRVGGQEIIERCHEDINVKKKYIIAFSEMASLCITKASELLGENIIINRIFLINPSKAKESDLYLGDISIIDGNSVAIKSWEKAVLGNVREFESNSNDIFDIIMRELENDK